MAGNKKQAASVKRNQGDDFHARIGSIGGRAKTERTKLRGFASLSPERVAEIQKLRWGERSKQ